ncbi:CpsD/CapB family tyrosine-protein kinase [Neobacillus sp. FSL H8-0543]|uniref:CpsD/CapB family tyrosine-protein kinase n=1 Tax=Neobacillus sp. FSL H8-0543 TaxID=2954672 RepID=UPI003158C7A6
MELLNRKSPNIMKKAGIITAINQNCRVSEQYRTIRTNFLSSLKGNTSRTLIITSPNRGEGKSTTAANFAISLAQQGKKVLLVDTDLRNSKLHAIFNLNNNIGLSNVLIGNNLLEDTIKKTEISGLDIIPSGPAPFNPAELLGSLAMELLIEKVNSLYDVVVFDTPPVLEVADAKIMANQCDSLILVIQFGKTQSDEAIEAKKLLESASAQLLGVILNGKE